MRGAHLSVFGWPPRGAHRLDSHLEKGAACWHIWLNEQTAACGQMLGLSLFTRRQNSAWPTVYSLAVVCCGLENVGEGVKARGWAPGLASGKPPAG